MLDGQPLAAYVRAYDAGGRVFAPVRPLISRLADRVWFERGTLLIEGRGERVQVKVVPGGANQLDGLYVMVAPVLRALGATVRYDAKQHRLIVNVPAHRIVVSPTPFNPAVPSVAPSAVFTAPVTPTPRPIWTGSPLPRRTALPAPPPRRASLAVRSRREPSKRHTCEDRGWRRSSR